MPSNRFTAAPALAGLKDFQKNTVEYVFKCLYGEDPTSRFLVADEVGLGKTLVARGIIAKTIEHLQDSVDRIDIVYICSNATIASQNIKRLKMRGLDAYLKALGSRAKTDERITFATRLTYLPKEVQSLNGNKVNFISLTPNTTFDHTRSRGGHADAQRGGRGLGLGEVEGKCRHADGGAAAEQATTTEGSVHRDLRSKEEPVGRLATAARILINKTEND